MLGGAPRSYHLFALVAFASKGVPNTTRLHLIQHRSSSCSPLWRQLLRVREQMPEAICCFIWVLEALAQRDVAYPEAALAVLGEPIMPASGRHVQGRLAQSPWAWPNMNASGYFMPCSKLQVHSLTHARFMAHDVPHVKHRSV